MLATPLNINHVPHACSSQSLPQPISQFRLAKLRQVVHALLTQINTLQLRNILCRRPADSLDNDRRVCLEDDAVVDNFVNGEGYEVIVFDYSALVY